MTIQFDKEAVLDRLTGSITQLIGAKASRVDYEIQDNFQFILFRAHDVHPGFRADGELVSAVHHELNAMKAMSLPWIVAFIDEFGHVEDAINSEDVDP